MGGCNAAGGRGGQRTRHRGASQFEIVATRRANKVTMGCSEIWCPLPIERLHLKYSSALDLAVVTLKFGTNSEILKVCPVYAGLLPLTRSVALFRDVPDVSNFLRLAKSQKQKSPFKISSTVQSCSVPYKFDSSEFRNGFPFQKTAKTNYNYKG